MASFDQNSKVANHALHFNHNMDFANVKIICFKANYHERLFLEAWHSTFDLKAENDRILLSKAYKDIAGA